MSSRHFSLAEKCMINAINRRYTALLYRELGHYVCTICGSTNDENSAEFKSQHNHNGVMDIRWYCKKCNCSYHCTSRFDHGKRAHRIKPPKPLSIIPTFTQPITLPAAAAAAAAAPAEVSPSATTANDGPK